MWSNAHKSLLSLCIFSKLHYSLKKTSFFTTDGLSTRAISSSTTSLTISWILENTLTATAYTISYFNTNTDCFSDSSTISGIAGSQTMYTLTGLEEGTEYSITVSASLTGGRTAVDNITSTTIITSKVLLLEILSSLLSHI